MTKYVNLELENLNRMETDIVNSVINEGVMREAERVEEKLYTMRMDALLAGDSTKVELLEEVMREFGYIL